VPQRKDDTPIFFLDRCLGTKDVATALRKAGAAVEIHDDHFQPGDDDVEWLSLVAEQGWVVLTKDEGFKRRSLERDALKRSRAAAFVLKGKNLNGEMMAKAFVAALPRMRRLIEKRSRPLIAVVSSTGQVSVLIGQRRGDIRR